MTSPLFHLTCLPHVRCGFIVFKLIFMWKVVRLLISVYKSRGESTKIWCDIYKNLPSKSGNKVYKWLFPSIHFYCFDASYDFTHGPDPLVCESSSLTPEGTDVRWALVTTAQLSSATAAVVGVGAWLGIKFFSTALLHLENRQVLLKVQTEKMVSIRKLTIQPISRSNLENLQHWPRKN